MVSTALTIKLSLPNQAGICVETSCSIAVLGTSVSSEDKARLEKMVADICGVYGGVPFAKDPKSIIAEVCDIMFPHWTFLTDGGAIRIKR